MLQLAKAWEGLPVWLGARDGVEVEACEAVRGHVGTQLDVVTEFQKEASFIGHVTVPCAPPTASAPPASAPAAPSTSPSASARAEQSAGVGADEGAPREGGGLPVCDAGGFWGPHGSRGGGGLRRGMWVRAGFYDVGGRAGTGVDDGRRAPAIDAAQPPSSAYAPQAQVLEGGADGAGSGAHDGWADGVATEGRAEDDCSLVGGGWEWQPAGCAQPALTERDCEACWRGLQRARFVGDSNCRDIYVEAATCVLGDYDPDLTVARQQTKHSNASVLLPSGRALDFVWCTHLDQVTAAAMALLHELQYRMELLQHQGDSSGAGREEPVGRDSVLVVGFAIWDVVVHLTPLQSMVKRIEPLLEVLGALRELGVSVVWLSPIPRTLMKRGILAGEKDVKVSYWRLRRWAHQLSRLMQSRGVAVIDSLHAAAALPEAFDGNHLGIACGWADTSQSSGRIAGSAGVCRHNGRLLARTVLRNLMGGLCPALPTPTQQLVRVLPTVVHASSASSLPASSAGSGEGAGSVGLVRHLRFSLLDGSSPGGRWAPTPRRARAQPLQVKEEDAEEEFFLEHSASKGGDAGAEPAAHAAAHAPARSHAPRPWREGEDAGAPGLMFTPGQRLVMRRGWPSGAVAEIRLRWCKLCRGGAGGGVGGGEMWGELRYAVVLLGDMPLATCSEPSCNMQVERLTPGEHTVTLMFYDTVDNLVSSVVYTVNVPLVDAMARNVALNAHGGRARAAFSQGEFDVSTSIDGVSLSLDNGWAYYGRLTDAEAIFIFSATSRVRRVVLTSGAHSQKYSLYSDFLL